MTRIPALAPLCVLALLSIGGLALSAQTAGDTFSAAQPELAGLFDASYAAQAMMFAGIAAIDTAPAAQPARDRFENSLRMRARMSMAEMMAMMSMQTGMRGQGPFAEWEASVRADMMVLLESPPPGSGLPPAYQGSTLPAGVVDVIRRGHAFEQRVYDVLADAALADTAGALGAAVEAYVAGGAAVPARPKAAHLLFEHPHAGAFFNGYPALSGLLWSTQWLQLATIEVLLAGNAGADTVLTRFQGKTSGAAASPVPVELPMAPAIAPRLYTLSPETAIVLDNLNMFETVVADVLSYPNVADRTAVLSALADEFTSPAGNLDDAIAYLESALRGGIYNQGGPALGELQASERNRSRMEMGMQHAMIMAQ